MPFNIFSLDPNEHIICTTHLNFIGPHTACYTKSRLPRLEFFGGPTFHNKNFEIFFLERKDEHWVANPNRWDKQLQSLERGSWVLVQKWRQRETNKLPHQRYVSDICWLRWWMIRIMRWTLKENLSWFTTTRVSEKKVAPLLQLAEGEPIIIPT